MNDIGRSVGIYFYVIGLIQVISIVINYLTIGNIYLDLQFIGFLAAGYYLMKHHNKTRKIVIIICGTIVIIQIGMFLYANLTTLPEYVSWKIMGFPVDWINDINKYLHLGTLIVALVFAIPFFILRSEKAIKEFNN